jgi:cell division protein FtsB
MTEELAAAIKIIEEQQREIEKLQFEREKLRYENKRLHQENFWLSGRGDNATD